MEIVAFTNLGAKDLVSLTHPAIAIILVFPLIGIVTNYAWHCCFSSVRVLLE